MCGICGKLQLDSTVPVEAELIRKMADRIRHRGPDDDGVWVHGNVGLGHRRLSIIDLEGGHQPLSNETGTVWIVFNGEIYNYKELRAGLESRGHVFATRSDTEVIVHLYEELGTELLPRLTGMFAFALYDVETGTLLLARDRVGIKPLYYALSGGALLFGSEVKAILADPNFESRVDVRGIDRFLTFQYMPGRTTLFQDVHKLEPGHSLVVRNGEIQRRRYWDLEFTSDQHEGTYAEAVDELGTLLRNVTSEHLMSDVPIGVFLSGGVDSTALLSLAVEESSENISTFTVGFDDPSVPDERHYARLAAERLGTDHHEITFPADQFWDFLPTYVRHMEEPVCEPPAIALYYLSRLAAKHVKVVLSGEGGDEAFAGYSTYRNQLLLKRLKSFAGPARGIASKLAGLLCVGSLRRFEQYAHALSLPLQDHYFSRTSNPLRLFNSRPGSLYSSALAEVSFKAWSLAPLRACFRRVRGRPTLEQLLYVDTNTWLPDDLLIKADKITMASSLELRVPLLDHRVLEFAASLPPNFKLSRGRTKRILKDCFKDRVPSEIITRKKGGFPVPYENWLRGPLKERVRGLLLDPKCLDRGYFRREAVEMLIDGEGFGRDTSKELFSLVILELWHREFIDNAGSSKREFAA